MPLSRRIHRLYVRHRSHVSPSQSSEFGVAAADCLRNDFYVDDGLKSVPSIDEAVTLISDVKQMCKSGIGIRVE